MNETQANLHNSIVNQLCCVIMDGYSCHGLSSGDMAELRLYAQSIAHEIRSNDPTAALEITDLLSEA